MEVFPGTLFGLANGYAGDLSSCSRKSINQSIRCVRYRTKILKPHPMLLGLEIRYCTVRGYVPPYLQTLRCFIHRYSGDCRFVLFTGWVV